MKKRTTIIIVLSAIVTILIFIGIARAVLPRQIDDVNPIRFCDTDLLERSDVLLIIPLMGNVSIADNPDWCEEILSLNKTLAMHGVSHTEKEFAHPRDEAYVKKGMDEFNKCFGFYPSVFGAPELALSRENKEMLHRMNFTVMSKSHYLTHKVYHCTDYEKKSWLVKLNNFNKIL